MNVVGQISIAVVIAAALLVAGHAVRARTLADRAVALDTITALITSGLLLGAAATGDGLLLELALVLGLLGFLTSVTVARFIERRGG